MWQAFTSGRSKWPTPIDILRGKGEIVDQLDGKTVILALDPADDRLSVTDDTGEEIPFIVTYWFVWKDIHSESGRYSPAGNDP